MVPAVKVLVARWGCRVTNTGRAWSPAWAWAGLQVEPEDRFSGRRRSPQQVPSLAAGGGHFRHLTYLYIACNYNTTYHNCR